MNIIAMGSLVVAATLMTSLAAARARNEGNLTMIASLSEHEATTLAFLREEEKLARDVYLFLGEVWSVAVFVNIAGAEQIHTDAILRKLVKYDLPDPSEGLGPGEFTEASGLTPIYWDLVTRGVVSELTALEVGVTIELMSIASLQTAIDQTDNPDLRRVYQQLLAGSENHLEAFSILLE